MTTTIFAVCSLVEQSAPTLEILLPLIDPKDLSAEEQETINAQVEKVHRAIHTFKQRFQEA